MLRIKVFLEILQLNLGEVEGFEGLNNFFFLFLLGLVLLLIGKDFVVTVPPLNFDPFSINVVSLILVFRHYFLLVVFPVGVVLVKIVHKSIQGVYLVIFLLLMALDFLPFFLFSSEQLFVFRI
jgi:hypothetical protein